MVAIQQPNNRSFSTHVYSERTDTQLHLNTGKGTQETLLPGLILMFALFLEIYNSLPLMQILFLPEKHSSQLPLPIGETIVLTRYIFLQPVFSFFIQERKSYLK